MFTRIESIHTHTDAHTHAQSPYIPMYIHMLRTPGTSSQQEPRVRGGVRAPKRRAIPKVRGAAPGVLAVSQHASSREGEACLGLLLRRTLRACQGLLLQLLRAVNRNNVRSRGPVEKCFCNLSTCYCTIVIQILEE